MKRPGWYPSGKYPGSDSKVTLTILKRAPRQKRELSGVALVALLSGLLLIAIGAGIQAPYVVGERAAYVISEGEIIEKEAVTNTRTSYRRGPRTTTYCKAKAIFMVDDVAHTIPLDDWKDRCSYSNGDNIKVTYHPEDVYGTATTVVYPYGIHPNALLFAGIGGAVCAGVGILSVARNPLKIRKRKR